MIQIIGAGFGRTGTLSLKIALETLGYNKCYHMFEVHQNPSHVDLWVDAVRGKSVDWKALFTGYAATCDWPSCNYWREQLAVYPQAKVLLTERNPQQWHKSVMNTIWPTTVTGLQSDDPRVRKGAQMAMEVIWEPVFHGRIEEPEYAIARFLEHNQRVKDEVPASALLVYEPGQGWEPICDFLECAVPDVPYPSVNSTEDFQKRVR